MAERFLREENHVPVSGGIDSTDATKAEPLRVNPSTGRLLTEATVSGLTSEYTEGDTDATITGIPILWEDSGDTLRAVSAAKPLPVDLGANNDVTVSGVVTVDATGQGDVPITLDGEEVAINDGGNVITVDGTVAATQSGTWNINDISGTISLPTGAATSANQSTIIGHVDGIEALLGTIDADTGGILTSVQLIDDAIYTEGDTDTTITGVPMLWEDSGDTLRAVSTGNALPVEQHYNGTAASTNTGNSNGGTQRVVLASDQPAVEVDLGANNDVTVTGTVSLSATDNAVLDQIELNTDDLLTTTDYNASFGTAGSADTQVRTVQGIASMTPLLVDATGQGDIPITLDGEEVAINDGGNSITVDGTVSLSAVDNAVLDAIDANTDGIEALLTTIDADTSDIHTNTDSMVTSLQLIDDANATISSTDVIRVAIFDDSDSQITSFGGGTQYTEDDAAPANPVGTAMMMERDDALGGLTPVEGDWTHPFATAEGALWVQDFNSDAILADTASIDSSTSTIAGAVSGSEMQVDIVSDGADLLTNTTFNAAFGTAGSADSQVMSVQGIASMTPIIVDATGQGDIPVTLDSEEVAINDGGNTITVDGTVSLSATDNAVLDAIDANTDGLEALLTTIDADTSTLAGTDFMLGTDFSAVFGSSDVTRSSGADNISNTNATHEVSNFNYYYDGSTWDRARGDSSNGMLVYLGSNDAVNIMLGDSEISATNPIHVASEKTSSATTSSSATVGTSSGTVIAANSDRKAVIITNDSDTTVYLRYGSPALVNSGIRLNANGGQIREETYTGIITARASAASKKVTVTEF